MPRRKDTKAKIVLEAKDKASRNIKKVDASFTKLVAGVAAGNVAANIASKTFGLLGKGIGELATATKVAARIQVLNRVFFMTGQQAGHTREALEDMKDKVMDLGIAEQEALQIGQRFIQAQLDIADATKVARAAQDLAVIAGTNSSETALQLTDAIVKQRPILLKQFGIIANLNDIYGRQAEALGKTKEALTETEKRSAFLNEIMRQSKTVAGAYTSAMKDVGKQMTSLPRHMQNAQNAVGKLFLPVMQIAVVSAKNFLVSIKNIAEALDTSLATSIKRAKKNMKDFKATSTELTDLSETYDTLKDRVNLTSVQQDILGEVTAKLAKIVPDAVTEWNEYGEAIGISTEKIKAFIEAQQTAIRSELVKNVRDIKNEFDRLSKVDTKQTAAQMAQLKTEIDRLKEAGADTGEVFRSAFRVALTPVAQLEEQLGLMNAQLTGTAERKKELIAFASVLFPNLKEGTVAYKDALVILGEELTASVVKHQAVGAAASGAVAKTIEQVKILSLQMLDAKLTTTEFLESMTSAWEDASTRFLIMNQLMESSADAAITQKQLEDDITSTIEENKTRTINVTRAMIRERLKLLRNDKENRLAIEQNLANQVVGIFQNRVGQMVDIMMEGRQSLAEVFKGMAADFIKFFVNAALESLANLLIPGLGKILGGIFDTRKNDLMAMQQGEHFAQWFTRGALGTVQNEFVPAFAGAVAGPAFGASAGQVGAASRPDVDAGAAAGNLIVQINGPITSADFVRDVIVPEFERVTVNASSDLLIDRSNLTGQDDAQFN